VRILVDESLPQELAEELDLERIHTVSELGWSGLANGALLRRAVTAGFDVLLTADQNLPFQQNIAGYGIGIIVLKARSNRIQDLRPLIPGIRQGLGILVPGQILRLTSP
jgi:rRNA-processing protein FCF1